MVHLMMVDVELFAPMTSSGGEIAGPSCTTRSDAFESSTEIS